MGQKESGRGEMKRKRGGEAGEVGEESKEGYVSANYCLYFGMEPVHVKISQHISECPPG